LALVAEVIPAVSDSHPQAVFDFVQGMNKWVLQVAAAPPIATALSGPLCGSTPDHHCRHQHSLINHQGRTMAGMPDSGSADVAPFRATPRRDPAGRLAGEQDALGLWLAR